MKIELTRGYAEVKEYYPRKIAKKIQQMLMEGVEMTNESEGTNVKSITKGINLDNSEKANDYLLCNMIEKLVYNDTENTVITVEILDELDNKDFQAIKKYIDDLSKTKEEEKKS